MLLQKIALKNFRSYQQENFEFSPFLTVITGENAKGKTNLLEAVYFLVNGSGFRESREEELINWEKNLCDVEGKFNQADAGFHYRIHLRKMPSGVDKNFFINKTRKKYFQYIAEQTRAILFTPEQIETISDGPDLRRDYFNRLISLYDLDYKKRLAAYESGLKRRNKILEIYRNDYQLKKELLFWDELLITHAGYLTKNRQEYCDYLNRHPDLEDKQFEIKYLPNRINGERLAEYFDREKIWRRTLIGPQKDDFEIYLKNKHEKNLHYYGSRSEQRLAVFWLKINEINYHEDTLKKKPILLLDDVFSELDRHNKKLVLDLIKKNQTVLTTTETDIINLIEVAKTIIKL